MAGCWLSFINLRSTCVDPTARGGIAVEKGSNGEMPRTGEHQAEAQLARHRFTIGRDTPTRTAITQFASPSAASNTILARCAAAGGPGR